MTNYPVILGVYCYHELGTAGLGGTARKDQLTTHYYVRHIDENKFELQPLNNRNIPSGIFSVVGRFKFLTNYSPEPKFYKFYTPPEMDSLLHKIDQGKKEFERGSLNESEEKLIQALMIDESNVDLNSYQESQDDENLDYIKFKKILEILKGEEEEFNLEQMQRINHFGISLRKSGYFDKSINYYEKTFQINEHDENVCFNLARVYYEKGNIEKCIDYLEKALNLNPQFEEARKFIRYCRG